VALQDEEADGDAVQPDDGVGATAPAEAIQVDVHDDAGESAEAEAKADEHDDAGESAEAEAKAVDAAGPVDEAERGDEVGLGNEAPADGSGSSPEAGADTGEAAEPTTHTHESLETVAAAVTEVLPTAQPLAAANAYAAPDDFSGAEPNAPAKDSAATIDPAATVVDAFPRTLAGVGAADGQAAGAPTVTAGGGTGSGKSISNTGGARRLPWKIATAAAAAAVIVIAIVVVAASSGTAAGHKAGQKASYAKKAEALSVVSVSPGNGATGVNGASPITVTYSGPIPKSTAMPTLSPSITGSWQVSGDKAIFTPQVGFTEDTHVTVTMPPSAGTSTAAATSFSFTTGHYSVLRLEQLLSQLGYIPVAWTPNDSSGDIPATDASAQLAAAYDPPSGTFTFDSGYPAALTSQWSVGTDNEIVDGAVRTFEYDHNLLMNGDAGRKVWSRLLTAIAKGERNQHGYTYVWVTQAGTEHLVLYHNGRVAIRSAVNTGIAASPTADGTFPVYLRYTVTQMIGTNPDGTPYDDTVYWVSYFNGGDAVHAFPRGGYGWYQSLGCVELPNYGPVAEDVWNLITYGTLVTVTGPVA
jgi:hypothetical protein